MISTCTMTVLLYGKIHVRVNSHITNFRIKQIYFSVRLVTNINAI
jgi:hypothetical protein